jgi:hypothetical protein
MADEMFGSNGDYSVAAFIKFLSDCPLLEPITIDLEHEVCLCNILNGSSEERTSLYPCEQIGSYLRELLTKKEINSAEERFQLL